MIAGLRAATRLFSVAVHLVGFSAWMRLRRPRPGSRAYEGWRREYFAGASRGLLRRLGVKVRAVGDFPTEPGILVTNHLGYLDVLVLASLGPAVFVSRADVAHWPMIGRLTRWCSTIYIDRERRDQIPQVIARMGDALESGAQVVFFPEGTSGAGDAVMPFRASLFGVVAETDAPVHVGAITYRTGEGDPPARDSVCWWGEAGFARHLLGLAALRQVDAEVTFPGVTLRGNDRKDLAARCHSAVAAAFRPVTGTSGAEV